MIHHSLPNSPSDSTHLLVPVFIVLAASIAGALIGIIGISLPSFLLIGIFCGLWLLVLRPDHILALAIIFAFAIAGLVRYFAATNSIANVAPMLLIVLLAKSFFDTKSSPDLAPKIITKGKRPSAIIYAYSGFLLIVIVSAFIHSDTSLALVFAIKTYLPAMALLIAAYHSANIQKRILKLWQLLLIIGIAQLPFVIYQHFFVAKARATSMIGPAWDSVVGTMGGNPDGGGSSGALAIFLSICLIHLINLGRLQLIPARLAIFGGISILSGIALAEVKIVFLLLPFGIATVFWHELRRRPLIAMLILLIGLLSTISIVALYQYLFWQNSKILGSDLEANIIRSFEYILDPNYFHSATGEVGRLAGILLWWREGFENPISAIFGHGPGASRINSLYIGDVARRYIPFSIDSTALSALLWDFGLSGALTFITALISGILLGIQQIQRSLDYRNSLCVHSATVGLVFMLISCIYNKDILYLPQMSLLTSFCLATIISTHNKNGIHTIHSYT